MARMTGEDGGDVLIGWRRPQPATFEGVVWGTGSAMAETRARLRAAGATWRELKASWDLDRPENLPRLADRWQGEELEFA